MASGRARASGCGKTLAAVSLAHLLLLYIRYLGVVFPLGVIATTLNKVLIYFLLHFQNQLFPLLRQKLVFSRDKRLSARHHHRLGRRGQQEGPRGGRQRRRNHRGHLRTSSSPHGSGERLGFLRSVKETSSKNALIPECVIQPSLGSLSSSLLLLFFNWQPLTTPRSGWFSQAATAFPIFFSSSTTITSGTISSSSLLFLSTLAAAAATAIRGCCCILLLWWRRRRR